MKKNSNIFQEDIKVPEIVLQKAECLLIAWMKTTKMMK